MSVLTAVPDDNPKRLADLVDRCTRALTTLGININALTYQSVHTTSGGQDGPGGAEVVFVFIWHEHGTERYHKYEMPADNDVIVRAAIDDRDKGTFQINDIADYVNDSGLGPMETDEDPDVYVEHDPIVKALTANPDQIEDADFTEVEEPASADTSALIERCHQWIHDNECDGEDRRGSRDRLSYSPDDLHNMIAEMIRDCSVS